MRTVGASIDHSLPRSGPAIAATMQRWKTSSFEPPSIASVVVHVRASLNVPLTARTLAATRTRR
jgi:hypothetical protein